MGAVDGFDVIRQPISGLIDLRHVFWGKMIQEFMKSDIGGRCLFRYAYILSGWPLTIVEVGGCGEGES
ncbi:hypothetical protein ColLi_09076 [Colletotrichum liriopes]|uniref:Uncharacterized protein n=1 Tax=Colletotrichum liriopes TaxID=708192 RepID=A0AA37GS50_9PEZI|nr:hypothetical protein ColLi_09076 [Colletotrichum liriopes]